MKTNVFLFAALLIAGLSVNAVAKEDPRNVSLAVVPVKGSDVFKVIYKNEGSSRVKLNLYNAQGQVIFSETISKEGFIRPLNLAGLHAGEYTVEVIDGNNKVVEKISYKLTSPVVSVNSSEKVVHVSKVKGAEKFVVTIANAAGENFVINIYDEKNNVIYSEKAAVNGSEAKLFSIANGKATRFEITDGSGATTVKNF